MRRLRLFIAFCMVWGLLPLILPAQQLAISDYHIFQPQFGNPGWLQSKPLTQFYLGHQHRQLAGIGWGTISQFLDMKIKPLGRHQNFGIGIYASNDIEHTERRLSAGVSMAVKLVQAPNYYFSVGGALGLINWGSNYSDVQIYDPGDNLIMRPSNFAELDAALGLSFGFDSYLIRAQADVSAKQLPGSVLSSSLDGLKLAPHLVGGGNILFSPVTDLYVGPMFYYRNTFSRDTLMGGIQKSQFDLGIRVDLDYPKMWLGGAYRIDRAAVHGMFGIQIQHTDTTDIEAQLATFVDLNFGFTCPLNESSVFGPSAELGLTISFGRVGEDRPDIDTIGRMDGAFWVNNGNMSMHKQRHLERPLGARRPSDFLAETDVRDKEVELNYEWDDNLYLYGGRNLDVRGDSAIVTLGEEWVGMDYMTELMVNEVVREALKPIHKDEVANPDSLEPLADLINIGIGCRLQFDQLAANFGAEGVIYRGELGFNNATGDSLLIPIYYGDADTVVRIADSAQITNLELAALKIYAMQLRLDHEMKKQKGNTYDFVHWWEKLRGGDKKIVFVDKPWIIPNNPQQKPFQRTFVTMTFKRIDGWEPIVTKTRKSAKNNKKRKREKRGKRYRNRYRDPVIEDEE